MASIDNLIPGAHKLTLEEQSAGGKASVEAKRKRKTLKEELILLLSSGDNQSSISVALLKKAIDGDVRAFEVIRDTIGEKPKDKLDVIANVTYEDALKKVSDKDEY